MKTFYTQTGAARRVGVDPATFAKRILTGVVKPSAVVIKGSSPCLLFDAAELPAIRRAVALAPEVIL